LPSLPTPQLLSLLCCCHTAATLLLLLPLTLDANSEQMME
jgi:hypothetical protein